MQSMIEAGAAGVHWEDQLASEKKCGHLGGKVLDPDPAARPHAERRPPGRRRRRRPDRRHRPHRRPGRDPDHLATSTSATSAFITGERTAEGFYKVTQRHRAVHRPRPRPTPRTPTCIWVETGTPGPRAGPQVRRGRQGRVPGPDARLQLLAVVQLEASTSTTPRSRSSSASSAPWATSSSSSPWPASTP